MIYARVAARAYAIFAACARFWIFFPKPRLQNRRSEGVSKNGRAQVRNSPRQNAPMSALYTPGTAGRDRRAIFKLFVQNPIRMAMHVAIWHMHCHASIFTYHR